MSITRQQVEEARTYIKSDAGKVSASIEKEVHLRADALMASIIASEEGLQALMQEQASLEQQIAEANEKLAKCKKSIEYYTEQVDTHATEDEVRNRDPLNQQIETCLRGREYYSFKRYGWGEPGNRLTKRAMPEVRTWPEWETLRKIDQLEDYLLRKATFCKSEDELAMLYGEFYRYDWRSAGLAIPPQLPAFITVGGHELRLLDYVPAADIPEDAR